MPKRNTAWLEWLVLQGCPYCNGYSSSQSQARNLLQKILNITIPYNIKPTKASLQCQFCHTVDSSTVTAFHVTEGSTVLLSCHYSVKHHGLSHVCWGRDCGTFWCNNIIVQTDENGVISKVSDRYRLIGDVLSGQMDLGIQRIQTTDSGPYCCRVDIEGYFNDKKVSYTLTVMKGKWGWVYL